MQSKKSFFLNTGENESSEKKIAVSQHCEEKTATKNRCVSGQITDRKTMRKMRLQMRVDMKTIRATEQRSAGDG